MRELPKRRIDDRQAGKLCRHPLRLQSCSSSIYSPPGFSWHNYGLAVDAAPLVNGNVIWTFDYKILKPIADGHSIEMGLFFPHPDSDHFEHKFGLDIKEAYHREAVKDLIPGTSFINLAA